MKKPKKTKGYRYGGMAGQADRTSPMTRNVMGFREGGMTGGSGSGVGRLEKSRNAKSGKVTTKRGYGAARKG